MVREWNNRRVLTRVQPVRRPLGNLLQSGLDASNLEFCALVARLRRTSVKISFSLPRLLRHLVAMGTRHDGRERAVQFLFQYDLNPPEDLEGALEQFWQSQRQAVLMKEKGPSTWGQPSEVPPPSPAEIAVRSFADPLIRGAIEHRDEIDGKIRHYAENWDLHRMAVVDRNVLRLAVYEMLYREDIPPIVSINEAVDIAKRFSTQDSGKFVNGILDRLKNDLMRPVRTVK